MGMVTLKQCHSYPLLKWLQSLGNKMFNIWVASTEIWCYNHQAPILGSASQNILLVPTPPNFSSTKSFGSSGWEVQSTPSLQPSSSVNMSVSVGGKLWITHVGVSQYSFVTRIDFRLGLGLGVALGLLSAARSSIHSFSCVRSEFLIFLSPSTTSAHAGCSHWYGQTSSGVTSFSMQQSTCTEWHKKTGTFGKKTNKNWWNSRKKKNYWQKLNHYNLPFKRQQSKLSMFENYVL